MLILPQNGLLSWLPKQEFAEFTQKLSEENNQWCTSLLTLRQLSVKWQQVSINNTYQLYRDYIDNFVLK